MAIRKFIRSAHKAPVRRKSAAKLKLVPSAQVSELHPQPTPNADVARRAGYSEGWGAGYKAAMAMSSPNADEIGDSCSRLRTLAAQLYVCQELLEKRRDPANAWIERTLMGIGDGLRAEIRTLGEES